MVVLFAILMPIKGVNGGIICELGWVVKGVEDFIECTSKVRCKGGLLRGLKQ